MVANIWKDCSRWARFSSIWWREGADPQTCGNFYKAVVQATLLFGSDTWVITPSIGRNLGALLHRVTRHLAVIQPKQYIMGRWEYPPMDKAMAAVGLDEVDAYVLCYHNTITHYIATRPILELCLAEERQLRARDLIYA